MATHSSILAWRTPWTEEPGGLQSMESQRVGHDWSNLARTWVFQRQDGRKAQSRTLFINYVTLKKSHKASCSVFTAWGGGAWQSIIPYLVIIVMVIISRYMGGVTFSFCFGMLKKVKGSSNHETFKKQASLSFSLHPVCRLIYKYTVSSWNIM